LKNLKEAEEKARQAKLGLFSTQERVTPKFTDLTQSKTNVSKIKQFFSFNASEKKIPAVVDLVLNGSRFKVRLINQQTSIIFTLHGVRCLPNDSNVKASAEISQKALQYSKENLLQRDVEAEFDSVDATGAICGTLTLNKKNYGVNLIENGLAYVARGGPKVIRYFHFD
jgi:staphylococcal nuclease domain-containing protein 1